MVKYKLKKWYPSLPKNWEIGMKVGGEKFFANIEQKYTPYVFFDPYEITNNPEFWEEVKEPLFITEDGVEIFENDIYYIVDWNFDISEEKASNSESSIKGCRYFSDFDLARKWIDENKPKYSKKDILNIIEEVFEHSIKELKIYVGEKLEHQIQFEGYYLSKLRDKIYYDKT